MQKVTFFLIQILGHHEGSSVEKKLKSPIQADQFRHCDRYSEKQPLHIFPVIAGGQPLQRGRDADAESSCRLLQPSRIKTAAPSSGPAEAETE